MRNIKDYAVITLKGLAMGAADVVPGVSGGTIALIAGIYQELINTLTSLNLDVLKVLKKDGIVAAFNFVNGKFFVSLIL
jgi:putative membrane protein